MDRKTTLRALRGFAIGLLALVVFIASGLLLADRLTPPATGTPSHALPLQPAQTELDLELTALLAPRPGLTGVLLVSDGLDAYAMRALATRKAGRSLDLQYYIWHDDLVGRLLAREVHAAAERGVRVRMLLDDLNAQGLDPKFMALDAHPNIELRLYNPIRNRHGPARILELLHRVFSLNHRMHNKAWIADGRVAVLGGRNIGEEYFAADSEVNFRDLDLLLFGPAVAEASGIFDAYWNSAAAVPIESLRPRHPDALARMLAGAEIQAELPGAQPYLARVEGSRGVRDYYRQALQPHWTDRLEVVADPPIKRPGAQRGEWLVDRLADMLGGARHKALVISPYFIPRDDGARTLGAMARRGVHVGVVTNSLAANDVPAVHSAYARYRVALLEDGVRLYETRVRGLPESAGLFGSSGASLHTKAFVVDDSRGFVGSFNLDPRSINLNTEMGVLFDDPAIAIDIRNEYLRLASPGLSYSLHLDAQGDLRWLDRAASPALAHAREPDTTPWQRGLAWILGLLPIESQL